VLTAPAESSKQHAARKSNVLRAAKLLLCLVLVNP
jgi:hypothetical protein